MKRKSNIPLGSFGETKAIDFLKNHGYRVIERNFKKPQGDIDIVAIENNTLVFIEVKTRKGDEFGFGEDAITHWKKRSLIRSAEYYKLLHTNLPDSMRIDMVSVRLTSDNQVSDIQLYKNITGW